MKTFIAAVVIIGISICVNADLTDEQKQKIKSDGDACLTETGVNPELVKKGRQGNFADDPKLKAFAGCLAKKVGFQDASGKTQIQVVRTILTAALNDGAAVDKLIEKCLHDKATPEESAFEQVKCYYDNTPLHLSIF